MVVAYFIKAALWGPVSNFLWKAGLTSPSQVRQTESDCVNMVAAILHRNPMHGHKKDLDGLRHAWRDIRETKRTLGIELSTDAIE